MKTNPRFRVLCAVFLGLAFAGIAHASRSSFTEVGADTYSYTRQSSTTFNRDVDQLTAEAKDDAAKYCASKGKQLKVVSITVDKPWYTLGFAKATVVFQALDAGDPQLAANDPVVVVDRHHKTSTTVIPASTSTNELYSDLLKLDELRKKGILSDEEFQAEKKKVLNRSK